MGLQRVGHDGATFTYLNHRLQQERMKLKSSQFEFYFIYFNFWLHHMAWGTFQQGMEPVPFAVEVWGLNHCTNRGVLSLNFKITNNFLQIGFRFISYLEFF